MFSEQLVLSYRQFLFACSYMLVVIEIKIIVNYVTCASCLLPSEYNKGTHLIKLCVSVTVKSIKQIVKVQNYVILIAQKWDNWL